MTYSFNIGNKNVFIYITYMYIYICVYIDMYYIALEMQIQKSVAEGVIFM